MGRTTKQKAKEHDFVLDSLLLCVVALASFRCCICLLFPGDFGAIAACNEFTLSRTKQLHCYGTSARRARCSAVADFWTLCTQVHHADVFAEVVCDRVSGWEEFIRHLCGDKASYTWPSDSRWWSVSCHKAECHQSCTLVKPTALNPAIQRPRHKVSYHCLLYTYISVTFLVFCMSRMWCKMYNGQARLSVWLSVCVCLSTATCRHYCTDRDVTWGNGKGCPLVVHYWADLQSVHGLHCYGNIVPNAKCQRVLVLALCLVCLCYLVGCVCQSVPVYLMLLSLFFIEIDTF